jgi:hypothetical protein
VRTAPGPHGGEQRLDSEEDEVGGADELDGAEHGLRRGEDGSEPCARRDRPDGLTRATPIAVKTPARRPPSSVLRIVSAVSGPGVAMTTAETARKERKVAISGGAPEDVQRS